MRAASFVKGFVWVCLCLVTLAASARGQIVKCASTTAEVEQRKEARRQEIARFRAELERRTVFNLMSSTQPSSLTLKSARDMSDAHIVTLIEDELYGRIARRELVIPVGAKINPRNSDYLTLTVDATGIPASMPDGTAEMTVEFRAAGRARVLETYTLLVCSGKPNRYIRKKPEKARRLKVTSFNPASVTYRVANSRVAMHYDVRAMGEHLSKLLDELRALNMSGATPPKPEDAEWALLAAAAANPSAVTPNCQIDSFLTVRELVASADAIVLARTKTMVKGAADVDGAERLIGFEVQKVLKGDVVPSDLTLTGVWAGSRWRQREEADCIPVSYAKRSSYLLFLRRAGDGLILYWYPKAPVNKRVSGENDAWVRQVEAELASPAEQKRW
jgi:hypothetical protein